MLGYFDDQMFSYCLDFRNISTLNTGPSDLGIPKVGELEVSSASAAVYRTNLSLIFVAVLNYRNDRVYAM